MTRLNNHVLLRTINTNATTPIFVACSILLITLGVAAVIGGSNHILYTTVNAQLEDAEELREELRASIGEKLQGGLNQNQSDQSAAAANPNGLTLSLDRAHYIPLSPLSDSPGNQVKMLPRLFCARSVRTCRRYGKRRNGSVCGKPNIIENFISSRTNRYLMIQKEVFSLLPHSMILHFKT